MSQWYCFRVPSQRELTAQEFLSEKRGLNAFVPYVLRVRRSRRGRSRETKLVKRTLLHGYIFIKCNDPYPLVHQFGILLSVVSFEEGKAPIVPESEIRHMQDQSGLMESTRTEIFKLQIGQTIRITNGAGQGLTGKITASKGERASVKLAKPLLGRDVIEVKTGSLEAA